MVNSDDTILDHIWAWRGDHGNGVGWTLNTADTGVVVNGDDVTAYGLFVEHYQKYQTIWNGERGPDVLLPERAPLRPAEPGRVRTARPAGLGVVQGRRRGDRPRGLGPGQSTPTSTRAWTSARTRAIEVPDAARRCKFHNMVTVFLDGSGGIERTINEAGTPVVGSYGTSTVVSYP